MRLFPALALLAIPGALALDEARGQQPQVEWIRQFGALRPETDSASAVDASGNLYVVGQTAADVFVRKYDAAGAELWTRIFGTVGTDRGNDLAVDASGVVVVGETNRSLPGFASSGGIDAVLRKYDHAGNELWTRQFGTTNDDRLSGETILGGEIYACGSTGRVLPGQTSAGSTDAFVVKYDASGTQLWMRQFGTPSVDTAASIRGAGATVFVAGTTSGSLHAPSSGLDDVFVRTYDTAGTAGWGVQFGSFGSDAALDLAVGASSLHVAGRTTSVLPGQASAGGVDAFLASYSLAGAPQWLRQFGGSGSDQASAVAVDATGIYVGGTVNPALPGQVSSGGDDGYVRKYDAAGVPLWTDQFGSSSFDQVLGLATGPAGVAACGQTGGALPGQVSAGNLDAFVRTYDGAGAVQWTRQFGVLQSATPEGATAVGADGSIYVAGWTIGGVFPGQSAFGQYDCYVRKYDATGTEAWTRQFGTSAVDWINGLAVDATGIYVVGLLGGANAFVRKYDASGTEQWTRQFGTTLSPAEALAVAVDGSNLFIAGRAEGSLDGQGPIGNQDAFLRKCDLNGNPIWTRVSGTPAAVTAGFAVAVHAGDVYLAGEVQGPLDGQALLGNGDGFLKKYDASGVAQWTRQFGTGGPERTRGLYVNSSGAYVCGRENNNFIDLRKYSSAGVEEWVRQPGFGTGWSVTGAAGRIYVAGECTASLQGQPWAGSSDLCVLQYDPAGNLGWTFQLGSSDLDLATAISVGSSRIYVAGRTRGVLPGQTGSNSDDAFVMVLRAGDAVAPIADAGPDQSIHAAHTVYLDGSSSNDETSPTSALTFAWTLIGRPVASTATLTGAGTATPSFYADQPGTYRVQLVVTDEAGNTSAADEVVVSSSNMAPTANAGLDQLVLVNHVAQLDGLASSDPDLDPLTWQWTILSAPIGSVASIGGTASGTPTFTPDQAGTYEIQLVVNDGFVSSVADTVTLLAVTASDLAQTRLHAACDQICSLASAGFDAPGHQKSLCNLIAQITSFIQREDLAQARAHLTDLITRADGWTLRNSVDPKGLGQPHAADFVVSESAQRALYALLLSALNAISS